MELISSYEMLLKAQKGKYAVPAFNVENMEMVLAVAEAVKEMKSPVIIQTTESTVRFASVDMYAGMVKAAAKEYNIPIALHIDHGEKYETLVSAISSGYTSVMIDGSKYDFEKNVNITKEIVKLAKCVNIPVEAELGRVGGKEDNTFVKDGDANLTDPKEAYEFVKATGVDSLAIAIGTAHGFYKSEPKIDFERISNIAEIVSIPLVLHGGTGVPDEMIIESIKRGMCKVNFATELRNAASMGARQILQDDSVIDPKIYMKESRKAVMELVKKKIEICGSYDKI
ncbi:MAG: ketose-bisphosphate aldolase [Lachnospirales bacterium]